MIEVVEDYFGKSINIHIVAETKNKIKISHQKDFHSCSSGDKGIMEIVCIYKRKKSKINSSSNNKSNWLNRNTM